MVGARLVTVTVRLRGAFDMLWEWERSMVVMQRTDRWLGKAGQSLALLRSLSRAAWRANCCSLFVTRIMELSKFERTTSSVKHEREMAVDLPWTTKATPLIPLSVLRIRTQITLLMSVLSRYAQWPQIWSCTRHEILQRGFLKEILNCGVYDAIHFLCFGLQLAFFHLEGTGTGR